MAHRLQCPPLMNLKQKIKQMWNHHYALPLAAEAAKAARKREAAAKGAATRRANALAKAKAMADMAPSVQTPTMLTYLDAMPAGA